MKLTGKELYEKFTEELSEKEFATIEKTLSKIKTKDLESVIYAHQAICDDLACVKDQIKVLKQVEASLNEQIEMLSNAVFKAMERENVTACCSASYKIEVKESKASSVIDEDLIPESFFKEKVTKTVNKAALLEYLKRGDEIPGAELVINKKLSVKEV